MLPNVLKPGAGKTAIALTLALSGAVLQSPAHGDVPPFPGSFSASNVELPIIRVTGSYGVFTQTTWATHQWKADISIVPFDDAKVVKWRVWPSVANTQDHVAGKPVPLDLTEWSSQGGPYPMGKYKVSETVEHLITTGLQAWSVQQCNNLASFLADNGYTPAEVHGIDRPLSVNWRIKSSITTYDPTPLGPPVGFGSGSLWTQERPSVIICEAISYPGYAVSGDGLAVDPPDFELMDIDLSVFYTASPQCPKDLMVQSTTQTSTQGQFRLWYEIQSANAGDLNSTQFTLNTGPMNGSGLMETSHSSSFSVPLSGLTPAGGNGATPGQVAGSAGFLPGVGAGGSGPVIPSGLGDFGNEVETPDNEHIGKIRVVAQTIEGLAANTQGGIVLAAEPGPQTLYSDWEDYHIVCEYDAEPVVTGLAGDLTDDMDDPYQAQFPANAIGALMDNPADPEPSHLSKGFGSKVAQLREDGLIPAAGLTEDRLTLISAKGIGGRLDLELKNQGAKTLHNREVALYLRGARVWHRKVTLRSGRQKRYRLNVAELDLPAGARGFQSFEIKANDVPLGTIMVDTGIRAAVADPSVAGEPDAGIAAPQQEAGKARVQITLSSQKVRLVEGDKVTLDLRLDNHGRGTSQRGVYTLECASGCPFDAARGSIKALASGDAKRYHLASRPLAPGHYSVFAKTPFGNSNTIRFRVEKKPERTRVRAPTGDHRNHRPRGG